MKKVLSILKRPSESDGVMEIKCEAKNPEMTCIDPHDCVNVSFFNIDLLYS